MPSRTHYENLQVSPNASAEVIRASYRALMQKYHPDRFADRARGERIAKILNEALAVLGDPERRAAYDGRLASAASSRQHEDAARTTPPPPRPAPTPSPTKRKVRKTFALDWVFVGLLLLLGGAFLANQFAPKLKNAKAAPSLISKRPGLVAAKSNTRINPPTQTQSPKNEFQIVYTSEIPKAPVPGTRGTILTTFNSVGKNGRPIRSIAYRLQIPTSPVPLAPVLIEREFNSGIQQTGDRLRGIAPMRIILPRTADVYYLKLVATTARKKPLVEMLGRGGEVLNVKVPVGMYRLRYMSGPTWYGLAEKFGPGVGGSESDADLTFSRDGNDVSGHEIELTQQLHGNLAETSVSPEDF